MKYILSLVITLLIWSIGFSQCFLGLTKSKAIQEIRDKYGYGFAINSDIADAYYFTPDNIAFQMIQFKNGKSYKSILKPLAESTLYSMMDIFDNRYQKVQYGTWLFKEKDNTIQVTLNYVSHSSNPNKRVPFGFDYTFYE